MITFKSDKLPEYIRIPGEADMTRVYEYKGRPMLCKKCNGYGHTEKRCWMSVATCGRCAGPGHRFDSCDSTTVKCSSCGGAHVTGHSTCPDERKEQEILVIQKKQKVGRARARQIFEMGGDIQMHNDVGKSYVKYIVICQIDPEQKLKLCPFMVEKFLQKEINITAIWQPEWLHNSEHQ